MQKQINRNQKHEKAHSNARVFECSNPNAMSEMLLHCIRTEDLDSFRSVLVSCLSSVNKTHFAKKAGLGRQTLYDLINPERGFNPELSTVAAIIRALAHEGKRFHV